VKRPFGVDTVMLPVTPAQTGPQVGVLNTVDPGVSVPV
jgi:hypothetical protein